MPIVKKAARSAAIAVALLFIGLSLFGILGVWVADRRATEIARKGFGIVKTAVGVVDAGGTRANNLIATTRTEVRQAFDTVTAAGARAEANGRVLTALNEQLETTLAPRIAQMQEVLASVRDASRRIGNAVSSLNSLPLMADHAPGLAALDETFNGLAGLSADASELRGTLQELVLAQTSDVSAEAIVRLSRLTKRIDTRLGEAQASVQGMQAECAALQVRLDTRKSRLVLIFNLAALLATLMLGWILYSQIIVIRQYRR